MGAHCDKMRAIEEEKNIAIFESCRERTGLEGMMRGLGLGAK